MPNPSPSITPATPASLLTDAREVLRSEAASIESVAAHLTPTIAQAITLIYQCTSTPPDASPSQLPITNYQLPRGGAAVGGGTVVTSGIGKSGLVAQRLSASFASTGTPSHFLHPVEALHGDLGRVRRSDIALLLSYSGETDELVRLLDSLKAQQIPVVAITSSRASTLGKLADITIELGRIEEVCPHGLAPTTSVTCLSVVGDALVLGVMSLRQFSREDFAAFHPAGTLGRKLLKVHQVMEFRLGENFSPLPDTLTLQEILSRDPATGRRAGAAVLINSANELSGVFTDGDLRRHLKSTPNLLSTPISTLMTKNPKRIHKDALASEALALFNKYRIDELPVTDDANHPIGVIDVQDLIRLRIIE